MCLFLERKTEEAHDYLEWSFCQVTIQTDTLHQHLRVPSDLHPHTHFASSFLLALGGPQKYGVRVSA